MSNTDFDEDLQDEEIEDANDQDADAEVSDASEGSSGQDEQQTESEGGADRPVREEQEQDRVLSRGERRFQKLANETREANTRAERLERELQEIRAERQRQTAQTQEREPSAEEMSLWSTDQIVQYRLDKATGKFNQTLQHMQFQNMESADKSSFTALCAGDARAKKYADEVETRLLELRRQGQNAQREVILKYVLGEKLMQQTARATTAQRKQGQQRIARQQGSNPPPRSDTRASRQAESEAEKRAKRLENVTF
jgi:hypothetical protein